jgi:hypothetical protein
MSTTPKMNMSLSEIFDVELTQTDKSLEVLQIEAKAESIDTLEIQRKYVKDNIVKLIEKGTQALDNLTNIANSTESSRDFQVLNEMINTLVKTNMTLLECEVVHKPKLDAMSKGDSTTTNNTAVFVGSTTDLAKHLKESALSAISNSIK